MQSASVTITNWSQPSTWQQSRAHSDGRQVAAIIRLLLFFFPLQVPGWSKPQGQPGCVWVKDTISDPEFFWRNEEWWQDKVVAEGRVNKAEAPNWCYWPRIKEEHPGSSAEVWRKGKTVRPAAIVSSRFGLSGLLLLTGVSGKQGWRAKVGIYSEFLNHVLCGHNHWIWNRREFLVCLLACLFIFLWICFLLSVRLGVNDMTCKASVSLSAKWIIGLSCPLNEKMHERDLGRYLLYTELILWCYPVLSVLYPKEETVQEPRFWARMFHDE